jgi:hypothetical protein
MKFSEFNERFGKFEGRRVPLDQPMIEQEGPELNKPKRNPDPGKKYVVYVKDPQSGNVRKITFGAQKDEKITAKINDPEAVKSFNARHKCDLKKDKMSAGYWACRLPRYAKELGLKGGGNYFW